MGLTAEMQVPATLMLRHIFETCFMFYVYQVRQMSTGGLIMNAANIQSKVWCWAC